MITEVQITCIVLMGLITLFLIGSLPRYTTAGKILDFSRKLLANGTLVVMIHFIFQYILHKSENNVEEVRTIINMIFGTPITYLIDVSYLYLLRQGKLTKSEWLYGPISFTVTLLVYASCLLVNDSFNWIPFINKITSVIYASVLIYYSILQIKEYFKIRTKIRSGEDLSQRALLKWTRFSMFTLVILSLGFPFMTFNPNLFMRSVYGVLSISACFFYILCFIGYSLNFSTRASLSLAMNEQGSARSPKKEPEINENKLEVMVMVTNEFIKSEHYLQPGITIKEAAIQMGISCNMLKVWLHTTPYEKFSNWINHLRLEKAKEMIIANPYLNCEEIAEQCGFCDRQYFQQLFKKQEGVSPSKWTKEKQFPYLQKNNLEGKKS